MRKHDPVDLVAISIDHLVDAVAIVFFIGSMAIITAILTGAA